MPKSKTTKTPLQSNARTKPESSKPKTRGSVSIPSYSALKKKFEAQAEELREALEQQAAMSKILQVIASSLTDIQAVLDTVAENAARLCDSDDAQIYRVESDHMRKVASYGNIPAARTLGDSRPITRGSPVGRAILEGVTVHIHDMRAEREEDYQSCGVSTSGSEFGHRSLLRYCARVFHWSNRDSPHRSPPIH